MEHGISMNFSKRVRNVLVFRVGGFTNPAEADRPPRGRLFYNGDRGRSSAFAQPRNLVWVS